MGVHVFPLGADLCTCCGLTRDKAAAHVKRGMRFQHSTFLDPETNQPLVCRVTKVQRGVVYYRDETGGSCYYTAGIVPFLKQRVKVVL